MRAYFWLITSFRPTTMEHMVTVFITVSRVVAITENVCWLATRFCHNNQDACGDSQRNQVSLGRFVAESRWQMVYAICTNKSQLSLADRPVQSLGQSFRKKYPSYWRCRINSLPTKCSISRGYPLYQNRARSFKPFRHNTVCDGQTHGQTDTAPWLIRR